MLDDVLDDELGLAALVSKRLDINHPVGSTVGVLSKFRPGHIHTTQ